MPDLLGENVLISLAQEAFSNSGYSVMREYPSDENTRRIFDLLAEDDFGIVGLEVYNTWEKLSSGWEDAQSSLVRLVSRKIARTSPKFFDAYLVLICRNPIERTEERFEIERDVNRVRKIVISSEDISSTSSFLRALDPLMPLDFTSDLGERNDSLSLLPDILGDRIEPQIMKKVIEAHINLSSPIEAIHESQRKK